MKRTELAMMSATILSGIIAKSGLAALGSHVTTSISLARHIVDLIGDEAPEPDAPAMATPAQVDIEVAAVSCDTKQMIDDLVGEARKPELSVIERQPVHRGKYRTQGRP